MEIGKSTGIEIPWENLSEEALMGVIDDFILREGTDYGLTEAPLENKRADILSQLKSRKVKLLFDSESESITLAPVL